MTYAKKKVALTLGGIAGGLAFNAVGTKAIEESFKENKKLGYLATGCYLIAAFGWVQLIHCVEKKVDRNYLEQMKEDQKEDIMKALKSRMDDPFIKDMYSCR